MAPVYGRMKFLARSDRYLNEKPYSLRYVPVADVGTDNLQRENVEVAIHDIRDLPEEPTFDKNGFIVLSMQSQLQYNDWFQDELVRKTFIPEACQLVKAVLGADSVEVFEYRIRRRSKTFPVSTGNALDWAQPVTTTHIHLSHTATDFNLDEIRKMVHYHHGDEAHTLIRGRFQGINLWKPLRGPVRDWPLAICDASTVDASSDLVMSDVVYADHVEENIQVHYNPNQKWLYLSDQQPSEMYMFRCADSWESSVGPGVPHASFENVSPLHDGVMRESIEARLLVFYNETA